MQIEATEVLARYRDELARMTERAIIAEAQVATLLGHSDQGETSDEG